MTTGPPAQLIVHGAQDPLTPQEPPPPQKPPLPPVLQDPSCASSTASTAQQPIPHMPPLNWSHFKPQFSGKPDEDAKAHLHGTNDWMDTHRLQDNEKVQRFCLTLTGECQTVV